MRERTAGMREGWVWCEKRGLECRKGGLGCGKEGCGVRREGWGVKREGWGAEREGWGASREGWGCGTTPTPLWCVPGKPRHLFVSLQENTTDIDENVRDRVSDEIKRFRENYKVWWCAGSAHVSTSGPVGIPVVNTAPYALLYAV